MPVCARCGRENPDQSSFCNGCGAAIVQLPAAAAEELKVVTVLFADITGSTALGERLDPEGLKEVIGAFFAAMRVEIEAEGGTVEKFIGDAIMAAFGVPRVHEDDPARALRAALRMRARLHELNAMLTERYGVALELRMGINTGSVMAVIDPRPGEALATGDAVNAAARLEQAAEPGQVLVAERTAQAARHFHFGPAKVLEVRGKAEPLRAVELVTEQPLTEGTLSSTRAPLVGRAARARPAHRHLPPHRRRGPPAPGHALRRGGRRQEPARRRAARGARVGRRRRRPCCAAAASPTGRASATGRSPRS